MSAAKQTLARHIETYASARASGNPDLQAFAANQLSAFIETIDFPADAPAEEVITPEVIKADKAK